MIRARREWLGLATAALFAVFVNVWIAGRWIAPAAIPSFLSIGGLCLAVGCWVGAQALLRQQLIRYREVTAEVDDLLSRAAHELRDGDADAALALLEAASVLDHERSDIAAAKADLREKLTARAAASPPSGV